MPKVSVVVPTFRSGPGLDRAIASLDAQTMPQSDIEVLLLDDGSPDDTARRIEAIAAGRPHYRAFALEASGWPSRPRNVGVREATGEFVLFLDHDDELFPDALRAAYDLGTTAGADVVNGKEVRTHIARWGITHYTHDSPDVRDEPLRGLLPMTPHKLYRRTFLVDHDVRFPEAPRHLWEDLFFHVEVLRHDPVVALLSSVPFYHWRATDENNSTAADGTLLDYSGDPQYWPYLEQLFARIVSLPAGPVRDELLLQNVQVRLVSQLGQRTAAATTPEQVEHARGEVARLLATYVPAELDARLPARPRAAITLFRAGRVAEAAAFLLDGAERRPEPLVSAVSADGPDAVTLAGTIRWHAPEGRPFARTREDGEVVRGYPDAVLTALEEHGLPVGPDLAATEVLVILRHQQDRTSWPVPTRVSVSLEELPDGTLAPVATFTARVEPGRGALGRPLAPGRYLVVVRSEIDGRAGIRRARTTVPAETEAGPVRTGVAANAGLLLRIAVPEPATASRLGDRLRRRLGRGR